MVRGGPAKKGELRWPSRLRCASSAVSRFSRTENFASTARVVSKSSAGRFLSSQLMMREFAAAARTIPAAATKGVEMRLVGKKVIIVEGRHKGNEGYVLYEDRYAVAIEAPDLIGGSAWYGRYYVRKEVIELAPN